MWVSHPICHVEPAETSSRKEHILLVVFRYARSFDKLRMTRIILNFSTEKYQADNLAKLWQEFLSVTKLIVKIFGAVSRTTSLMRLSALLACKRCRCRNDGFCLDEEQESHGLNQNPTYKAYVILGQIVPDEVIR